LSPPEVPTVVYVHGAGNKPPADALKRVWDQDLFGRDMGQRTTMAHYTDLLHPTPGAIGADACTQEEALAALVLAAGATETAGEPAPDDTDLLAGLTPQGQRLALSLTMSMAAQAASQPPTVEESLAAILPLPASLRQLLLRQLLQRLIPDADAYFFTNKKEPIRQRLHQALYPVAGPAVVIAHSLGTVIAYDVLREPRFTNRTVPLLVTLGSPLGYTEIQDIVTKPLQLPAPSGYGPTSPIPSTSSPSTAPWPTNTRERPGSLTRGSTTPPQQPRCLRLPECHQGPLNRERRPPPS